MKVQRLTFREQAAIAYATSPIDTDAGWLDDGTAAGWAQGLADACCEAWGHEPVDALSWCGKCREHIPQTCARCGARNDGSGWKK